MNRDADIWNFDLRADIKRKIEEAGMRELHRAIEAWDWPPKKVDLEN